MADRRHLLGARGGYRRIFIAWFALLFTGRYPDGLYNFVAGYIRFANRVNGFTGC